MSTNTKIEWTDATWNPVIGCSRVSEGCRNCYAEGIAGRFGAGKDTVYSGLTQIVNGRAVWTGNIAETKQLLDPLRWRTPKRVFVNSMSDLFHENVTDEQRDRIFAVMALCPQHTFQVLTKRVHRQHPYLTGSNVGGRVLKSMMEIDPKAERVVDVRWPLPNVWLGVSVENQAAADERIPLLLQVPAAVRFISAEPLLGPVNLGHGCADGLPIFKTAKGCRMRGMPAGNDLGEVSEGWYKHHGNIHPWLDWVICGGESGPGARPMHPDWARSLRDQCQSAGVPFFFKQWGEWVPWQPDGSYCEWKSQAGKLMDRHGFPDFKDADVKGWTDDLLLAGDDNCVHQRVGKKAAGRLLDGREWNEFPAVR